MNENIDLTKILKDCPKGTKLYTTVWGEVTFNRIDNEKQLYPICIEVDADYITSLTKKGYYANKIDADCILFPSKDQRDWSKFTAPWYKKEKLVELKESKDKKIREAILNGLIDCRDAPDLGWSNFGGIHIDDCITWLENQGEQNLSSANERTWLYLVSDVLTWKDGIGQYLDDPRVQEIANRLCSKYAQKLYNPSVISSSSNTVKNEQKFDPKTLQPFDRILIRDRSNGKWSCSLFSHIDNELQYPSVCANGLTWKCCIPYNEETKHLVGTNNEAPEYYRYWED